MKTINEYQVPFSEQDLNDIVVVVRPLADWWGNKIQWCEDDHEDLVQEGMLWLVKTLQGYNKSGKPIHDLKALVSVIFSGAMKWWYKKSDRTFNFVALEGLRIPVDNMESHFSQIVVDEYLGELERLHGAIARQVVEELVAPSSKVGDVALQDMEAKKDRKNAGEQVVGYASPRVCKGYIRQALNLDNKQWDKEIAHTKSFTARFFSGQNANLAQVSTRTHSTSEFPSCSWFPTTDPAILRYREELGRRSGIVEQFAKEHECLRNPEKKNGTIPSQQSMPRRGSASLTPASTMPSLR